MNYQCTGCKHNYLIEKWIFDEDSTEEEHYKYLPDNCDNCIRRKLPLWWEGCYERITARVDKFAIKELSK